MIERTCSTGAPTLAMPSATSRNACAVPRCERTTHYRSEYCSKHRQQALKGFMWVPLDCVVCGRPMTERRGGWEACAGRCRDLRNNLKRFGLTVAQYRTMYDAQGGRCVGCRDHYPLFSAVDRNRLYVDHCHATGRVRGLLCASCNLAIGKMRDDPDIAHRLSAYLRQGRQSSAAA